MIASLPFKIKPVKEADAKSIHHFMVKNKKRFELYFPKTLFDNISLSKSQIYAKTKEEEFRNKSSFVFAIKPLDSQQVIALIIIKDVRWDSKSAEIAYCMDEEFSGQGWTSLAVNYLTEFATKTLQLERIKIIAHKTNRASIKVAENCDYLWIKTLKNEYKPKNGVPLDMELYEFRAHEG